ncbi:MAG: DUF2782 domain-containing protein [Proteobacteria bacterium]|nr:DUF2782 domain-containing protein [Pseudomonadota bacterium]
MRIHRTPLIVAALLAMAPIAAFAQQEIAPAPPPPSLDDPGQPPAPVKPDDPRLAPLPPESAPAAPAPPAAIKGHEKSDGDPTNAPALPTDDAFHPPPKKPSETVTADGYSIRSYTAENGDKIEEFRHGGQLTRVRVQPANGPAFEINDNNGDGRINRNDATSKQTLPVQWSLFEWH